MEGITILLKYNKSNAVSNLIDINKIPETILR